MLYQRSLLSYQPGYQHMLIHKFSDQMLSFLDYYFHQVQQWYEFLHRSLIPLQYHMNIEDRLFYRKHNRLNIIYLCIKSLCNPLMKQEYQMLFLLSDNYDMRNQLFQDFYHLLLAEHLKCEDYRL